MGYPYDEGQVSGFIDDSIAAYTEAGRALDPQFAIWTARMQFDATTMGYPAAREKQLQSLRTELGMAPPVPTPIPPGQFVPAPREWRGQMCGIHVEGLPAINWGPPDPTLALSWLYDRYAPEHRAQMRAEWHRRHYTHIMLSWPDARAFNPDPAHFRDIVVELLTDGFFPGVMWCSKDFDLPDVQTILDGIEPAVQALIGIVPLCCIGWELSLWLSPTQVQQLIDVLAPRFVAYGCRVYVHFQQGYSSFQQPNKFFADFWNLQVGKLTGTLHQRILDQTPDEYRGDSGGLIDVLQRFAGNFGVTPDSGFGHPFDLVAWEVTAMTQFNGETTEHQGDVWGSWALGTPSQGGSTGQVGVIGTGNGALDPGQAHRLVPFTGQTKSRLPWRQRVGRLIDLNAKG